MSTKYYEDQLARVGSPEPNTLTAKFIHTKGPFTNWLAINKDSAQVLVNWLNSQYNLQPTASIHHVTALYESTESRDMYHVFYDYPILSKSVGIYSLDMISEMIGCSVSELKLKIK